MPETSPEPPTVLPDDKPVLGERIPADDTLVEIPISFIIKLPTITFSRHEIRSLASTDKCLQKLLRHRLKLKNTPTASLEELELQITRAANEYKALTRMKNELALNRAETDTVEAKIRRRLVTIQEMQETRRIRSIRGRLGIRPKAVATG